MLNVNLKGMFFTTQAALPALRASRGVVVNIASDSALLGTPNSAAYCTSKGGVIAMTRALAVELAPGIRVTCVVPSATDTGLMREQAAASDDPEAFYRDARRYMLMGRLAEPEEIARAILYLASDDASFIIGSALTIDGGATAGY